MVLGVGEVGQDSLEMEGLAGVGQRGARGDGEVRWARGQERPGERTSVWAGWQQGEQREQMSVTWNQTTRPAARRTPPAPGVPPRSPSRHLGSPRPVSWAGLARQRRGDSSSSACTFRHPLVPLSSTAGGGRTRTSPLPRGPARSSLEQPPAAEEPLGASVRGQTRVTQDHKGQRARPHTRAELPGGHIGPHPCGMLAAVPRRRSTRSPRTSPSNEREEYGSARGSAHPAPSPRGQAVPGPQVLMA